jgi:hypothetical protein
VKKPAKRNNSAKKGRKGGWKRADLSATVNRWATEAGMDDATLLRWLIRAGIKIVPGKPVQARDIINAIRGDDKSERTALVRSQRELNEIEKAEKEKTLVPRAELEADLWSRVLLPFRNDFLALAKKHGIVQQVEELMAKHFQEQLKNKETKGMK